MSDHGRSIDPVGVGIRFGRHAALQHRDSGSDIKVPYCLTDRDMKAALMFWGWAIGNQVDGTIRWEVLGYLARVPVSSYRRDPGAVVTEKQPDRRCALTWINNAHAEACTCDGSESTVSRGNRRASQPRSSNSR